MIATVEEIKNILGIEGADQDSRVRSLVPFYEDQLFGYCNNWFTTEEYAENELTFTASTNSVTGEFSDFDVVAGNTVLIRGSKQNSGVHRIESKTDSQIVFTSETTIADETTVNEYIVSMFRTEYPEDLKLAMAFLIGERLNNVSGMKSEKIGSYSYSVDRGSADEYPDHIAKILNKYRAITLS